MDRRRVAQCGLWVLVFVATPAAAWAEEIPYFARKYGVTCAQCHVSPPKLNEFGEAFAAAGYRYAEAEATEATWPFAVWLSGRMDALAVDGRSMEALVWYLNRLELVSGGPVLVPWLSYFVEWRAVSLEARGDGSLRDRSGRFEDLLLLAGGDAVEVTVGQYRPMAQVDVSRRLGVAEPRVFSAGVSGIGDGSARRVALRGFAPSARSPGLRVARHGGLPGSWRYTVSGLVPFPGELSLPLTEEARVEASNELELRAKGFFGEAFARRGLWSVGGHVFAGRGDRWLAQAVTTGRRGAVFWTGVAGGWREGDGAWRGRWSGQAEYAPRPWLAAGGRVERVAGRDDGWRFTPYANLHYPGTSYTFRLTVEQRVQRGDPATLVELGTVF